MVTGSIAGGDGGPWQVMVESEDQRRTAPQTTGADGSFSIAVDPTTPWISVGGVKLVIDGRWEVLVNPNAPATIELPVSTSISVTARHPETGDLLPDARVLAYDLGVSESAGGLRYLGRDDGAALIQDTTNPSGAATLTDIPVASTRVLLFACLDGQIDAIYADLSQGAREFTMPSDADGALGAFEDEADGDRNGIADGDGNRDGLRDSLQSNVATLPSTVAGDLGSLVTIAAPAGTVLRT